MLVALILFIIINNQLKHLSAPAPAPPFSSSLEAFSAWSGGTKRWLSLMPCVFSVRESGRWKWANQLKNNKSRGKSWRREASASGVFTPLLLVSFPCGPERARDWGWGWGKIWTHGDLDLALSVFMWSLNPCSFICRTRMSTGNG